MNHFHCRLEYFSVTFNILLALIYLFTDGFRLICWHISERDDFTFRVCVSLKLLLWSFVFLNLLPFNFLIPTLYGRKFHLWLNLFFLLWYGSCVWNSVSVPYFVSVSFTSNPVWIILLIFNQQPILQYMYHQIYHTNNNSNDCFGGSSVSRYAVVDFYSNFVISKQTN